MTAYVMNQSEFHPKFLSPKKCPPEADSPNRLRVSFTDQLWMKTPQRPPYLSRVESHGRDPLTRLLDKLQKLIQKQSR